MSDKGMTPKIRPETRLVYLEVMLQARIASWEASLEAWQGMNSTGLHSEAVADRMARIEELKEVMRLMDEV